MRTQIEFRKKPTFHQLIFLRHVTFQWCMLLPHERRTHTHITAQLICVAKSIFYCGESEVINLLALARNDK
jgi:hypothetical protein